MSRTDFISLILDDKRPSKPSAPTSSHSGSGAGVLLDATVFGGASSTPASDISFARALLEGSGFGDAQYLERVEVILGDNPAARSLPDRVYYWPKTGDRPHQTLLFQLGKTSTGLLEDNLFRDLRRNERLEDALHRLIQHSQQGFAKGGERRTASIKQGSPEETLILVSVEDDRHSCEFPVNLVCFGTVSSEHKSFETFLISDETRQWAKENRPLAEDHLSRLYYRHFSKLATDNWQDAFVTGEERNLARKLLDVCTELRPDAKRIQTSTVKLVREIAKSFGRGYQSASIVFDELPRDHFIGADPQAVERPGFRNAFEGMTVRDGRERLLGYSIYCLDEKTQADRLRNSLEQHNAFHNVLVIYPDGDEANLELWQGKKPLKGKLTKAGVQCRGEGEVVNLLSRFFVVSKSELSSPAELARELAHRARYLRLIALGELEREKALPESDKRPVLKLYDIFDKALARQTEAEFADAYAQTLTYGLLAARWMARSTDKPFTAKTVGDLLPSTSPFLVDLFQQLIALRIAPRLGWLIEDLVSLLHRTSVNEVFADEDRDPVIHFYEDFLDAYDPSIRATRGVYYTPDEVVQYIINTTHHLIIDEFGLRLGLADTTTWGDFAEAKGISVPDGVAPEEPFVQLLDPATGTGTFLKYAIEVIYDTMMRAWAGSNWANDPEEHQRKHAKQWNHYIHKHLLPRVNGFELMMAPYIVCHLRLGLVLQETGFSFGVGDRLRVFLTNTLEPISSPQLTMIGAHVAEEAGLAEDLKNRPVVTVLVGNPPYAGHSSNNGVWARDLVAQYREIDGKPLHLAQGKWLQNDYVKFIAYAESRLRHSGVGILAYITDHSYLDGDTFPGMRHHLLRTFSRLDVMDLHGDLNRREHPPTGGVDENIFNIQQGVAIVVLSAVRVDLGTAGKFSVANIWGTRDYKFSVLENAAHGEGVSLRKTTPSRPHFLFVANKAALGIDSEFASFDAVDQVFSPNGRAAPGFLTTHDAFAIAFTQEALEDNVKIVVESPDEESARKAIKLCNQNQWSYERTKHELADGSWKGSITRCLYRPFDERWTAYNTNVLVHRRERVNSHLREPGNLALLVTRMTKGDDFRHVFVTNKITEVICLSSKTSANAFVFPLFLRKDGPLTGPERSLVNIERSILNAYGVLLGQSPEPKQLFFYIYGILWSPSYRRRYNELFVRCFPRVPRPREKRLFQEVSSLGERLVEFHLMEGIGQHGESTLEGAGSRDAAPGMPKYDVRSKRIYINKSQYFPEVDKQVWDYKIGSYNLCKKWLEVRKLRELSQEEVVRFSGILNALRSTIELEQQVDAVIDQHGGWPDAFVTTDGGAA